MSDLNRRSKFTYRQLSQLSKYSTDTPLRVIAHIDLDAFYAQCEVRRLGLPETEPLAVQQWQSLIAVNYPAREFGVSRHETATDALKSCPTLKLVHVATWRAGDTHWAYRDTPNIATCKACLDPYRNESKKILTIFWGACPRVEKASIDESFLDLSGMIHEHLLQRYPVLTLPPPYSDPLENLPLPPQDAVEWGGSHLLELEEGGGVLDWDDIGMALAAEIVGAVRAEVKRSLGYTCSAGIAGNKMLAKLGSGYKKPNQQTVVRTGAIQKFLNSFKFTKLRNLGGKFGTQVSESFNTEQLVDLLPITLPQLQSKLSDDTATWVYNVIRGIDKSEVNPRTQMKSMLSAKSFRPTINTHNQAHKWLLIFVSDIHSRLEDEGVMEGKRRPKTMTITHRTPTQGSQKTRQVAIPSGKELTVEVLMALAEGLLKGVVAEGAAYPCAMLGLQVAGFEEREVGNMGIAGFLVKGEQARGKERVEDRVKKRKVDEGIGRFFRKGADVDGDVDTEDMETGDVSEEMVEEGGEAVGAEDAPVEDVEISPGGLVPVDPPADDSQDHPMTYTCSRCATEVPVQDQEEHEDWHFAKSLADEDKAAARERIAAARAASPLPTAQGSSKKGNVPKKGGGKGAKKGGGMEKGQSKLVFGK